MGKFRSVLMMMTCMACAGVGCPACQFTGEVAKVEQVPETERLPRVGVNEPFAALVHEGVMGYVPPGMLVDLAEQAQARGELPEEALADMLEDGLCTAEDFVSELEDAAEARGITRSQLLARMMLHGTCGPENCPSEPAPPIPTRPTFSRSLPFEPRRGRPGSRRVVECPAPCRRRVDCPACEAQA